MSWVPVVAVMGIVMDNRSIAGFRKHMVKGNILPTLLVWHIMY